MDSRIHGREVQTGVCSLPVLRFWSKTVEEGSFLPATYLKTTYTGDFRMRQARPFPLWDPAVRRGLIVRQDGERTVEGRRRREEKQMVQPRPDRLSDLRHRERALDRGREGAGREQQSGHESWKAKSDMGESGPIR